MLKASYSISILLYTISVFISITNKPLFSIDHTYYSIVSLSAVETIIKNPEYKINELSMPIQNNNMIFSIGRKFYKDFSFELFGLTYSNYLMSDSIDGKSITSFYGINTNYDFKFGDTKKPFTYTSGIGFGLSTLTGILGYSNALTFNLKQSFGYRIQKNLDLLFSINAIFANYEFEDINILKEDNCENTIVIPEDNTALIVYDTITSEILKKTNSSTLSVGMLHGSNNELALRAISDLKLYDTIKISDLSYTITEHIDDSTTNQYRFYPEYNIEDDIMKDLIIPSDTLVTNIDTGENVAIKNLTTDNLENNPMVILLDQSVDWIKGDALLNSTPIASESGDTITFQVTKSDTSNSNQETVKYTVLRQKDIENIVIENLLEYNNNNDTEVEDTDTRSTKEETITEKQTLQMNDLGKTINLMFSIGLKLML